MSNIPKKFWGKTVTLKNRYTNEYLFADDIFYDHTRNRRYIFTAINKKKVPGKGEWILMPENKDDGQIFTLKNKYFSEYLYAAGEDYTFNSKSGYGVSGGVNVPLGMSVSGSTTVFGHHKNRFVFTWNNKNEKVGQGYWFLEAVPEVPDHFLLKNTQHVEYMFNEKYPYNSELRYVYTSGEGSVVASKPECHWEIKISE